ncbi:MAG: cytochrome-c oxidase, cbb3-type subunit I [Bdellovibrionales bacterium]|nr:cytochrome-c oxidase, cbb3-type subunit I [Bdellovibrionales bacterium]
MNSASKSYYDDDIVKMFLFATLGWGVTAFLVGLIAALQISFWQINFGLEWLSFGRLRPLHTNAAIFAFAGNIVFAGIYHSSQRLLRVRLFNDFLSRFHFWGWQFIILSAVITLPLGFSQGKEYAELEWPIDIAIAIVWVVFAVNFFATLFRRKEKHLYVALWFYIATIVTVTVLHVVNSLSIPIGFMKSYTVWAGVQDAMVQWWYGHNAVAFFLTTPFLGLMYYYLPKIANRPVYSYRLSIVHFWGLVFMYIWAGPHHLLNTAMPDWAQTLGMVFSLMIWAPSWGGMINGLLTLRGAWNLLRTEPSMKFLVAAITFYGMSTFEGPLLSIKSVNALAHYSDWIIGHVHSGALGWNGYMAFGIVYYLLPRLYKVPLFSLRLANIHFWLGTLGILFYYLSMVSAGLTQGLMWLALDNDGVLIYPDFVETVNRIKPLYHIRTCGGLFFLIGTFIMLYNIYKTVRNAKTIQKEDIPSSAYYKPDPTLDKGHRRLEGMAAIFTVLTVIAILVGSVISILPTLSMHSYVKPETISKPWTPLEQAGRDIYVSEGCYVCHSQMIRKLSFDVARFGPASTIGESLYDHPFQWGSKRTGPDLARVGGKYPDLWHYNHMIDPRSVIAQSLMPAYLWLEKKTTDFYSLRRKLSVLKTLGVPYDDETVANADKIAAEQAFVVANRLSSQGAPAGLENKQIVALIAYLQALGKKGGEQ